MRKIALLIILLVIAAASAAYYYYYSPNSNPQQELTLYGNVDIRQVDLSFRVFGRVKELRFEEGDTIKAGDLLAVLDKVPYQDVLHEAKAKIDSITASLENAQKILDRRKDLIDIGGISQEEFDTASSQQTIYQANLKEAEAALAIAKTSLEDTELYSPSSGVILTRIREPGTIVNPGEPIYALSLDDPIWVRAYVSEPNLGRIYPGMEAEVHTDAKDGKIYKGHIGFISPLAEFTPKTVETTALRTDLVYRLRIIVDNPDHYLRQGMPVTVVLKQVRKDG